MIFFVLVPPTLFLFFFYFDTDWIPPLHLRVCKVDAPIWLPTNLGLHSTRQAVLLAGYPRQRQGEARQK